MVELTELAIRTFLKNKLKKSDEEVTAFMSIIGSDDQSQQRKAVEYLETMGMAIDTLKKIPESMRASVGPALSHTMNEISNPDYAGGGRRGVGSKAAELAETIAVLKSVNENPEVDALKRTVEDMRSQLIKKDQEHLVYQQTLIQKQLDELKSGKMSLDPNNLPMLLQQVNSIRAMSGHPPLKDVTELVGIGSSSSYDMYKNVLVKAGFSVKGPENIEDKMLQMQKETEDKLRKELKIDEKRTHMILSFFGDSISSVMNTLGQNVNSEKGRAVLQTLSGTVSNLGSLVDVETVDEEEGTELVNPAENLNRQVAENVTPPAETAPPDQVVISSGENRKKTAPDQVEQA